MRILALVTAAAFSVGSCVSSPLPALAPDAPVVPEAGAAFQPGTAEPTAGRGDADASLIQLAIDVTASGAEGEPRVWRVSAGAPSGEELVATTRAIQLSATAVRSSDSAILLDHLHVAYEHIESTVRGLVVQDGERTVILEETDPARGSVTIGVTATVNPGSGRRRP